MSRRLLKLVAGAAAGVMMISLMTGCGKKDEKEPVQQQTQQETQQASTAAPQEIVRLKSIYPGDEPKGIQEVLTALNGRMAGDIGVELELTWAPWDQYYNKVEVGVAAGEKIDYIWNGSSVMANYTSKKIIVPIDAQLEKYGKPLYDAVDESMFNTMKVDGKIMGFPSTGNSPRTDVNFVLTYREDLRLKYDLPKLDTLENIEKYFQTMKEKEPTISPLVSQTVGYTFMRAFGPERMLAGTNGAVAYKIIDDKTIELMPIQQAGSWLGANRIARKWYLEGYVPKDILNMSDPYAQIRLGAAAAANGTAMKASEEQGSVNLNLPGAMLADQMLAPDEPKYMNGNGGNALYVTSVCKNPDKVVQFWGWVLSSQENYDLYCYGIKDKHYEIKDNRIAYKNSDYSTFPNWMFKNLKFLRFPEGASDEYIAAVKDWDVGARVSPILDFVFNPENVKSELAQFKAAFDTYSKAINSGTLDFDQMLPEIVEKCKAAGQEKIVAEAKRQIEEYFKNRN